MWKQILIATDGTEPAQIAAGQAIALAKLSNSQLSAIFVADYADFDQDIADQMVLEGKTELKRLKKIATAEGVSLKGMLQAGNPVDEILAVAEEVHADLIVMAAHHYDFFYHLLVQPSVSDRVIHKAAQSILVVNALPQA